MASTLGASNPFRYRGYYYDTESGWYYLNSRYYDPQVGRFINADSYVSTGQGLSGYNMFAYCNNNPVMFADPSGQFGIGTLLVLGACALSGLLLTGCSSGPAAYETEDELERYINGNYYNTVHDAVDAAFDEVETAYLTNKAAGIDHEWGCLVYQNDYNGKYYISSLLEGTWEKVDLEAARVGEGNTVLASVHTHG